MKRINILAALMLLAITAQGQNLVPKPVSLEANDMVYTLTLPVYIHYETTEEAPLASYLAGYLPGSTLSGGIPPISYYPQGSYIYLYIQPDMELPTEGYRLEVSHSVSITGKDYGGLFNGIQTFLQLLPADVYNKHTRDFNWEINGVTIEDYPRFSYRGQMLDVARTFTPKEGILRFIDNISYHKINKMHWHLADDEGWRIEIKSYPDLTGIGAFRGGDSPIKPIYGAWDERYGGYYTQDDIREIVAYAAVRNVEIIPEIDLPGHSRTAAIVYPDILCDYTPNLTATAGYDRRNVWCVSKDSNYEMLDNIIREISELFPSEYIHLGGDEVEPGQWRQCPHCKALMKEKGIQDAVGLEDVFMERAVAIAGKHGKKAGAWVEASYRGKLDKSALVYGWKNDMKTTRKAAADGYPTIMAAGKYFYFDMRQSQNETGHIWAGIVSPETVYSFDFEKEGFTAAEMKNVKGVEATFFAELLLPNGPDFLDYQLFPRICVLSEVAWTPQTERSWSSFERRLNASHYNRMDAMGIKYRTPPGTKSTTEQSKPKTPAVVFSSSLKEATKYPFSNVSSYKGMARTSVTCKNADWFLWRFTEPVTCRSIRVGTGYTHLQRAGVPHGYVEASYDGVNFERVGRMENGGELKFQPEKAVRAIRIVSETEGNGEPFVIIQPIEIK